MEEEIDNLNRKWKRGVNNLIKKQNVIKELNFRKIRTYQMLKNKQDKKMGFNKVRIHDVDYYQKKRLLRGDRSDQLLDRIGIYYKYL